VHHLEQQKSVFETVDARCKHEDCKIMCCWMEAHMRNT